MVTAAELLNRMSTTNFESEGHIVIGIDRHIYVPDALKRIAVQYDHNVETVTFDCPRYWDNTDLSTIPLYINYMLPDGSKASYIANNINVDDDIVHFDWTISNNVTQLKGNIRFLVCAKSTDEDGNEHLHWNSELCDACYISEGMEADESAEITHPDIVTQLLERMLVVEGYYDEMVELTQRAEEASGSAVVSKDTVMDILDEVTIYRDEVVDSASEIRNSYANAIKGTASGEIVRVDDVSPLEHDIKVCVHGRNLFDSNDNRTEKDYGTGEYIYGFSTKHLIIGREYTVFSEEPMRWFKISNSVTGYSCCGLSNTISGFNSYTFIYNRHPNISDDEPLKIYVGNLDRTADTDLTALEAMKICIVEGPVATTYESYINPSTTTVIACGKNLAPVNNFTITGTPMAYGSIGDFTDSVLVRNIPIKPGKTYTISAIKPDQVTSMTAFLYNGLLKDTVVKHNGCYTATYMEGRGTQIQIPSDGVITNTDGYEYMAITTGNTSGYAEGTQVTINIRKLQIELGDSATIFETYKSSEINGGLDVTTKSVSPIMNVFSTKPDVIVDVEYNRDTEKVIDNIEISGGGVVDQSYKYTSKNAQSGTAVAEAIAINKNYVDEKLGDISTALDELHVYAQTLVNGGASE